MTSSCAIQRMIGRNKTEMLEAMMMMVKVVCSVPPVTTSSNLYCKLSSKTRVKVKTMTRHRYLCKSSISPSVITRQTVIEERDSSQNSVSVCVKSAS